MKTSSTSKRVRLMVWLGLALVVALMAVAGPKAGSVGDVEDNSPVATLPTGSGSQHVQAELGTFAQDDLTPVVVVYARDTSTLSAADKAAIEADRPSAQALAAGGQVPPMVVSADGKAATVTFQVQRERADGFDRLADLRAEVADGLPDGLAAKVTGPYAALYDSVQVFDGIDGKIMGFSALVVVILLLITYRSPVMWLLPLLAIGVATAVAQALIVVLADGAGMHVDSQAGGLLPVFVFGVGTDYALLVIARYREELTVTADRFTAALTATRHAAGPVLASSATIVLGFLCLLWADLGSSRSIGAVGAVGVGSAALSMLVTLPVLLALTGRWPFWPLVPRVAPGSSSIAGSRGLWATVARVVERRRRPILFASMAALALCTLGWMGTTLGTTPTQAYRTVPDSVVGQEILGRHFPAGASAPTLVTVNAAAVDAAGSAAAATSGVVGVSPPTLSRDRARALLVVTLSDDPDSSKAQETVRHLRTALSDVHDAEPAVGGPTAERVDTRDAMVHDMRRVFPLVLLIVLIVLGIMLRSIALPLALLAAQLLSYAAALGLGAAVLRALDLPAVDIELPLLSFVVLVAVGVDYTIFLMSRVLTESRQFGPKDGVSRGLIATGGVITSAGLVLAATFGVLATMPTTFMIGLGVTVAIGLLLDTFVVRSLLVPSLVHVGGYRIWWPGLRPPEVRYGSAQDRIEPAGAHVQ